MVALYLACNSTTETHIWLSIRKAFKLSKKKKTKPKLNTFKSKKLHFGRFRDHAPFRFA